MIKVVIADDHALVRKGLGEIINGEADMEVVGYAADGAEAFMAIENTNTTILLLDLSMPPGESGLVTAKRVVEKYKDVKIIILTMYETEEYIAQAFAIGAKGYLLKSASNSEVLKAIRNVSKDNKYLDVKLQHLFDIVNKPTTSTRHQAFPNSYELLSKREQEVLPFIALGYGNKEIANKLFISVKTVEAHKAHLMKKLKLTSRVELIRYAIKHNLIDV